VEIRAFRRVFSKSSPRVKGQKFGRRIERKREREDGRERLSFPSQRVALAMRDFLDGSMRPRDFSVFSLALGERKTAARSRDESARVHAIEAAARREKGSAEEAGDEKGCWRRGSEGEGDRRIGW